MINPRVRDEREATIPLWLVAFALAAITGGLTAAIEIIRILRL